jgi:hypothetical protein
MDFYKRLKVKNEFKVFCDNPIRREMLLAAGFVMHFFGH